MNLFDLASYYIASGLESIEIPMLNKKDDIKERYPILVSTFLAKLDLRMVSILELCPIVQFRHI